MKLSVHSVDYAPQELHEQCPIEIELIREISGPDRPDYWLGRCAKPLRWIRDNLEQTVEYVVVAARWQGTRIEPKARHLPIGIAYVTDESVLNDESLDLAKCAYVAIGIVSEVRGSKVPDGPSEVISGTIARGFGLGGSD